MYKLNLEIPINNLSFGNVSFGLTYELFKRNIDCRIFPIGQQVDVSAFDKAPKEYIEWLQHSINNALASFDRTVPVLKLWHINSSQNKVADKQFLFTFHELTSLTPIECNLLRNQDGVFVASEFNKNVFKACGVNNVHAVGLGFDSLHFRRLSKRLIPNDVIGFSLLGKGELRKQSYEVLRLWAKKYGNNSKYFLNAQIYNGFIKPEDNHALINQALDGQRYHNINILPFVKTLTEYNQILNASDIVLGMSRGEAWGLPEFSSVALGKFAVIHNAAGYQSWANPENSVLVQPSGMTDPYDGLFFQPGAPFNQGKYFTWNADDFYAGCEQAEKLVLEKKVNETGLKLQEQCTWVKTVDQILNVMGV